MRLKRLELSGFKSFVDPTKIELGNGINAMDTSGEHALTLLVERLQAAGYEVYFSGLKEQITDIMRRTGLLMKIGRDHIFPTLAMAINAFWEKAHIGSKEKTCPLKTVCTTHKE